MFLCDLTNSPRAHLDNELDSVKNVSHTLVTDGRNDRDHISQESYSRISEGVNQELGKSNLPVIKQSECPELNESMEERS